MLSVPVYDETGAKIGAEQIDEGLLGNEVNASLLKQVVVAYHANRRQGHAVTKSRSDVVGSTKKLYRQKGTGRARMGNARTPQRRGGGMAFAKRVRDFRQALPKKMRRLARNQAVLAKINSNEALIVDGLRFDVPKTSRFATFLKKVDADNGCLFAMAEPNETLYKSGRNIPRTEIRPVAELNAYDILARRKLIFTRDAFASFRASVGGAQKASE
ncbi:MAG: 50S ribosomal protein L4 [Phycisphaerae bacterium]|jgi:large subunit ribosomal protein L4|nr:50S ribosomal protein L4 [Phycisphaerae bacterium]HOO16360.1 50S ribosomal protein L4 [Phycisphaerae bacterium]HPC22073.1 50S ribosomal protein L4 [Phycisphaerae bacterium]HRS27092.1 50S ribosomal protein L4 [Phycisphaerae bacterium]HRT40701.1 50S ribosomal protein L4 [Phycisphaerae bacterium]